MLGVVRYPGAVAMPPLREDLKRIGDAEVLQGSVASRDAGFLREFARCRGGKRLIRMTEGTGHRLPKPGTAGGREKQDLDPDRMDRHEDGDRKLCAHFSL